MSEGKKAFVVLMLLLDFSNKDCPILIDQPEDDLDNRAIYNELVTYIKRKKKFRKILLIVNGKNKGEAVKKFLENKEITTALPISFLWLHNDVTVILDEEAAACLKPEYK